MPNAKDQGLLFVEGETLKQPVYTRNGNLLVEKGSKITPKVLELLDVFQIAHAESFLSEDPSNTYMELSGFTSDLNLHTSDMNEDLPDEDSRQSPSSFNFKITDSSDKEPYWKEVVDLLKELIESYQKGKPVSLISVKVQIKNMLIAYPDYSPLYCNHYLTNLPSFYRHALLVCISSGKLAEWLGLPMTDRIDAALAGLLHDIGKILIQRDLDDVDSKQNSHAIERSKQQFASLSEQNGVEDTAEHSILGYTWLKQCRGANEAVKLAVLQHHEQMNGQGVPLKLTSGQIHPLARIVAIANCYHEVKLMADSRGHDEYSANKEQLVSPYLRADNVTKASFGELDPAMSQLFVQKVTSVQQGNRVMLNDTREGIIVFTPPSSPIRPWIKVDGKIINLISEKQINILDVWPANLLEKRFVP